MSIYVWYPATGHALVRTTPPLACAVADVPRAARPSCLPRPLRRRVAEVIVRRPPTFSSRRRPLAFSNTPTLVLQESRLLPRRSLHRRKRHRRSWPGSPPFRSLHRRRRRHRGKMLQGSPSSPRSPHRRRREPINSHRHGEYLY